MLLSGDSAQTPQRRVSLTVATPSDSTVCKVKSWLTHLPLILALPPVVSMVNYRSTSLPVLRDTESLYLTASVSLW